MHYLLLIIIWGISILFDFVWVSQHKLPPAWDQGSHLSTAFDISYLFNSINIFDSSWWDDLWNKSPSYRGPFTYIISAIFFKVFGLSYKVAILSNQLFNFILILSIYFIGRFAHNRSAGLWAAFLCSVSPAFLIQRTDYLIDLSLTSVITLGWLFLCISRLRIFNPWLNSFLCGIVE